MILLKMCFTLYVKSSQSNRRGPEFVSQQQSYGKNAARQQALNCYHWIMFDRVVANIK